METHSETETEAPARPDGLPDEFWDAEAGRVRLDELVGAYSAFASAAAAPDAANHSDGAAAAQDATTRSDGGVSAAAPDAATRSDGGAAAPDAATRSDGGAAAQDAATRSDGGAAAQDAATRSAAAAAERPPARPEDYALELDGLIGGPDAEANRRMHEAGFTNAQVQLVYDMASSLLLPLAGEVAGELERAEREARLAERYGGEDGWRRAKGQMQAWAAANLPPGVGEALTGSIDGAAALERLMDVGEPGLGGHDGARPAGASTLDDLRRLQGDPRYWRDRDPALVARVMEGYRRLYPGAGEADPEDS